MSMRVVCLYALRPAKKGNLLPSMTEQNSYATSLSIYGVGLSLTTDLIFLSYATRSFLKRLYASA